jgi:predicted ATPase
LKRFILTGTPGAGKTAILRQLEADGFSVVEEAATDVIALSQARGVAEPWTEPAFVDAVAALQRQRLLRASQEADDVQFHDRSAVCSLALARYLGHPVSAALDDEIDRIRVEELFRKQIFFILNRGFVEPTGARRISFEESLRFEQIHEETYRSLGFELMFIEPGPLVNRAAALREAVRAILGRTG